VAEPKTVRGLTALHVARALVKICEAKGARLVSHFDGSGYARYKLGSATLTNGKPQISGKTFSSPRVQVSAQDRIQVASALIHLNVTSEDNFENTDLQVFIKIVAKAIKAGMKAQGIW
jgi:hypothetical protein